MPGTGAEENGREDVEKIRNKSAVTVAVERRFGVESRLQHPGNSAQSRIHCAATTTGSNVPAWTYSL